MTDRRQTTPQVVFACVRNGGRSVISRVLTEHYARRPGPRPVGRHPARRAHPPRGRRRRWRSSASTPRREHPKLLTRETIAASDHGHHPRLRRGVPLRPRRDVRRLAGRGPGRPGRGDGARASSPTSTAGYAACSSSWSRTSSCRRPSWPEPRAGGWSRSVVLAPLEEHGVPPHSVELGDARRGLRGWRSRPSGAARWRLGSRGTPRSAASTGRRRRPR